MDNLILEASSWLRDPKSKEGSIQDRTQSVLALFKSYIKRNKTELETNTGVPVKDLIDEVVRCQTLFGSIIDSYLKGVHHIAITSANKFIKGINSTILPKGARLYKARECKSNYLFGKDELFHIPYDKRNKIGNQRFSVSGMPCLYLASSTYVCWEELGRVDFSLCNFCGFSNQIDVPLYDFVIPPIINTMADVKRVSAILACSLSAERDALFKEEYILPQCFLQSLILKHHYFHIDQRLFAVRYLSVHLLNGDADCFKIDLNETTWVNRLYNYVFPAASAEKSGHNTLLRDLFVQTNPTSMFKETLLHPEKLVSGDSHDVYLDSQFGLMDAFIDDKMGYKPLRKEGTILTI